MSTYHHTSSPGIPGKETTLHVLTEDESTVLLSAARLEYFRDFVLMETALLTGLRNSEITGLRIEHVAPFGEISTQLELTADIAKNHHPRTVPIHTVLRTTLEEFLGWKMARGQATAPDSPLFTTAHTGRPLSPRDFQRIVKSYATRVLHRRITPHMFRHTFATNVLRRANIRIVQKLLGHQNLQTTQIYTHPSTADMSNAIEAIQHPHAMSF